MTESRGSRTELVDAIIDLARHDPGFRQALLDDPRAAVGNRFGISIPDNYRIRFIERDPDVDALIVLPPPEDARDESNELSDKDLEIVVGGAHAPRHGEPHFDWSDLV